ncbi:MAG TPA: hypothetical protein PLP05_09300, partial [Sedimentisphaerales bacterium]|nr:hypothetical protein [Sedimentisphaerales bacterium]
TEGQINDILEKIAVNDPNEAKQLEKLRKENPDMFTKQLHEHMMKKLRQRMMDGPDCRMPQGDRVPQMGEGPGDGNGFRGERFAQMEKKKEEYSKWLQENYPDEFTKLQELKEKEPELYFRQMMVSGKKYGRIFETSKSNPELASILKEDLALKQKREDLLKQISTAKDEEKAELTKQLEAVVAQRFDLILKRKQLAYDKLRERLEKLKEEVKTSQDEVEKWKDTKDAKVKERVKELLERSEKFNWEE